MDKQTHIVNQAKRLPVKERRELVDAINETIKRDESLIEPRYRLADLIDIGEVVFNTTYEERRKAEKSVLIRNCCAKMMRMEGYTFAAIGKAMKRHPTSVMTMNKRADEMEAGYFGYEVKTLFHEFRRMAMFES